MKKQRTKFKMIGMIANLWQKSFLVLLMLLSASMVSAQEDESEKARKLANTYINQAEDALGENDFAGAEAAYRKAIAIDPSNAAAKYNMGNLYYGRERNLQSQSRFNQAKEVSANKEEKHRISHNLGNSFMKQKKYKEAVEAYKEALRNDPGDDETRYNLALAKEKLKEQQKQNQDQNKDQNKDQNQDNQDQEKDQNEQGDKGDNKDENGKPENQGDDKNQDPKDGKGDQENKEPEDQNQPNQGKDQKDQKGNPEQQKNQQPQQPVQGQLSKQQIQSLLEAMNNEEGKVQDKINAEKAKGAKTKSDKDW